MTDLDDYLRDLLDEVARIEAFTEEGEAAFLLDVRTQYAVMMAYARMGEIAKRLPDDLLATQPHAEWRAIKGFRDVLLHRYDEIQPSRLWAAVRKLPQLKSAILLIRASLSQYKRPDTGL